MFRKLGRPQQVLAQEKYKYKVDDIDFKILNILKSDARTSIKAIAAKCNVSRGLVYKRLYMMRKGGIITRTTCCVDLQKIGYNTYASVDIRLKNSCTIENAVEILKNIPEVMEIDITTGSTPISIRLCAADIMNLEEILYEKIQMTSGMIIHNCRTFVPYYRK